MRIDEGNFDRAVPCKVAPFPLTRRIGEIREIAETLFKKRTIKAVDAYRAKVSERLFAELAMAGMSEAEQDETVGAFFDAVEIEISRQRPYGCRCHAW